MSDADRDGKLESSDLSVNWRPNGLDQVGRDGPIWKYKEETGIKSQCLLFPTAEAAQHGRKGIDLIPNMELCYMTFSSQRNSTKDLSNDLTTFPFPLLRNVCLHKTEILHVISNDFRRIIIITYKPE